jgi:hypothetical protein
MSIAPPEKFVLVPAGACLYHCSSRTRPHAIAARNRTHAWVYVCPRGTVSTVAFFGGARRPSPVVTRRYLQSRLGGRERIRPRDIRAATRHGPELGLEAERWTQRDGRRDSMYLLYWRRYPRKMRRGYSYLYACFKHGAGEVRFYPGLGSRNVPACPYCAARS